MSDDYTGPRRVSSVTEACGMTAETRRGESEQDKAASPDQLERREHWRRADPVAIRGTQTDDPTGLGFMGMPDVSQEAWRRGNLPGEDPEHEPLVPHEPYQPPTESDLQENLRRREGKGVHPDDPEGNGYHGTVEVLDGKPRGTSHVTHPANAAPPATAITNVA